MTPRHRRASIGMDQRTIARSRELISMQPIRGNHRNDRATYWLLVSPFGNISPSALLM